MNPFGAHRFYEVLGLWEVQVLTALRRRVAPLKKGLTCVGDLSWLGSYEDLVKVSRILALGGSFVRVLRVWEVPGRDTFRRPKAPGGSAREDLTRAGGGGVGRGGEGGSGARVLRVLEALGSSFVCVLRVGEALGGSGV